MPRHGPPTFWRTHADIRTWKSALSAVAAAIKAGAGLWAGPWAGWWAEQVHFQEILLGRLSSMLAAAEDRKYRC